MASGISHRLEVPMKPGSSVVPSTTRFLTIIDSISPTSEIKTASSSSTGQSVPGSEDECCQPCCEIRSTPEKGKCLFACRSIKPGTLVFSEEPLVRLSRQLENSWNAVDAAFSLLTRQEKKLYKSLFDAKKSRMSAIVSIYYSNCYSTDAFVAPDNKVDRGGGSCIGALASRINHSCVPNVCFSYLPPSITRPRGQMRFYAIKSIAKGKELLSNYDNSIFEVAARRQQKHLLHYGFRCACEACAPVSTFWLRSDERRITMYEVAGKLKSLERRWQRSAEDQSRDDTSTIELCQEAVQQLTRLEDALLKENLVGTPLANAYRSLARWSLRAGQSPHKWVLKEHKITVIMSGRNSLRSRALQNDMVVIVD